MARELSVFLAKAAERRFEPGHWDCGLWLADWAVQATGCDLCPELRYLAKTDWDRHARRLPLTAARVLRRAGVARVAPSKARPGDIGVLRFGGIFIGAIRTGIGWAVLTPTGLRCGRFEPHVIAAWRLNG